MPDSAAWSFSAKAATLASSLKTGMTTETLEEDVVMGAVWPKPGRNSSGVSKTRSAVPREGRIGIDAMTDDADRPYPPKTIGSRLVMNMFVVIPLNML